ncbi:Traf-like family protein [Thalictrum thalictroides]|uniref:Traf-like family protein n=1 Tax=Thalictrum thalictroides TaxID=46969 RepID=A0A7J6WBH3_THATH|nr:Traf-like family protein [Thalictrum thalictroides]
MYLFQKIHCMANCVLAFIDGNSDCCPRSQSATKATVNAGLFQVNGLLVDPASDFESRAYKWKLVFHPNGNKEKGVKDHISLYLVMADHTTSLPKGSEVCVNLRLFMLDQKRDKYVNIEDPSNGYLVDDTCVFGADVIVLKRATKDKHTWWVCGFSDVFVVGGKKWKIELDPMGDVNGEKDGYISIFLVLDDSQSLFHVEKFYVKFKILILQSLGKHMEL